MVVFDRQLYRRGRYKADVDHVAADGFQCRQDHAMEERSRDAAVPAHYDWSSGLEPRCPSAEAGGVGCDHFRREPSADTATDAGDGNHQSFKG